MRHFDAALSNFEADVHADKAPIQLHTRGTPAGSGGGSFGAVELIALRTLIAIKASRRVRRHAGNGSPVVVRARSEVQTNSDVAPRA